MKSFKKNNNDNNNNNKHATKMLTCGWLAAGKKEEDGWKLKEDS